MFRFKDCVPYNLVSGVLYEYMSSRCNSSYYGETERHLNVRSGEHKGISLFNFAKTKLSKKILTRGDLLQCDKNTSFDDCTIEAHENKKYLLEIKEILLIKRDQPTLNENISSIMLNLSDTI